MILCGYCKKEIRIEMIAIVTTDDKKPSVSIYCQHCEKMCISNSRQLPYPPVPICPYCSKEMLEDPVDPGWYCEKGFGCHGPTNGVYEFTRRKEE